MNKSLILLVFSCISPALFATELSPSDENKKETIFEIQEREQKEKIQKIDEQFQDYDFIKNNFYEDEGLRIYNNTAYQMDHAQNKIVEGQTRKLDVDDFAVSFGYGMEFKLNSIHKVGYEYVSSFPYDRGQMVRFFWSKRF